MLLGECDIEEEVVATISRVDYADVPYHSILVRVTEGLNAKLTSWYLARNNAI